MPLRGERKTLAQNNVSIEVSNTSYGWPKTPRWGPRSVGQGVKHLVGGLPPERSAD
jgi:hypothetical protein